MFQRLILVKLGINLLVQLLQKSRNKQKLCYCKINKISIVIELTSITKVKNIINWLKNNVVSFDKITGNILKEVINYISQPLVYIINSISYIYPEHFNIAEVVAIY